MQLTRCFRSTDFLLLLLLGSFVESNNIELTIRRSPLSANQCFESLLSSSDTFPDTSFSASSILNDRLDFQPYQARLTNVYDSQEHTSGYAWCPDSPIHNRQREWLQAEFPHLVIISTIFTAGRGDGNVKEFMPSFVLRYQREDDGEWFEHSNRDGTKVLQANSDPRNAVRATLDSVVIAKRIRVYPYSPTPNPHVCLRLALFGCSFPDGIVSYSMPQGGIHQPRHGLTLNNAMQVAVASFKDLTYDGRPTRSSSGYMHLHAGLGQLTDNLAYMGNVTNQLDLIPDQTGFHFVGWHRDEHEKVEIVFKFDADRNFTWLRLFTFDSIMLNARLFDRVVVDFSRDGRKFDSPLEFATGRSKLISPSSSSFTSSSGASSSSSRSKLSRNEPDAPMLYADDKWDGAIVVQLDLNNRVGRFVRVKLSSVDQWLLLSEVQFNSTFAVPPPKEGESALHGSSKSLKDKQSPTSIDTRSQSDVVDKTLLVDSSSIVNAASNPSDHQDETDPLLTNFQNAPLLEQPLSWVYVVVICIGSIIVVIFFALLTVCIILRSGRYVRTGNGHKRHKNHLVATGPNDQFTAAYASMPQNHDPMNSMMAGQFMRGNGYFNGSAPLSSTANNGAFLGPPPPPPLMYQSHVNQPLLVVPSRPLPPTTGVAAAANTTPTSQVENLSGQVLAMQCSPNSSCSSQALTNGSGADTQALLAQQTQPDNAGQPTSGVNDVGNLSPEYASASIFGLTPPPSEVQPNSLINGHPIYGGFPVATLHPGQSNQQVVNFSQFQPTTSALMYLPQTALDGSGIVTSPAGYCPAPTLTSGGIPQQPGMYLLYEPSAQMSFPADRHTSWMMPPNNNNNNNPGDPNSVAAFPGTWTINSRVNRATSQPPPQPNGGLHLMAYPTLTRQQQHYVGPHQFPAPPPPPSINPPPVPFSSADARPQFSTNDPQILSNGTEDGSNSGRLSIYSVCP